ncbi:IS110 family transposase [Arthrobacter cupressi]|uniref:Transposase IS116/IS110/IS902 family protein n=1 Tax=Arthrobacter cupressi TaxID=1045773 RepID=A0A1G8N2Z1_9MICC|nr:IS110 family transposase [Arthrobacter cupressi]NYD77027.1 transposase [Arthrobacter cupressi]NYD78359.1 transposase [Arthrobacter cupressi]SDI74641.1 Transposase IS116/IS110/IS902 family protein [Arthrobacter cupressi]
MSVQSLGAAGSLVVVAVDVGKNVVALSVTDAGRHRLLGPVDFEMTGRGLDWVLGLIRSKLAGLDVPVKVGIEAAGHYHRPLLGPSVWPAGWQVLELNPAHVAEQRRVQGRRRVKTDALDLEAITELVLAGRGLPVTAREAVIGELGAWAAHRTRRVQARTATKNQLLGQLDRAFPGLTLVLPDVLGTKVGKLIAAEFADPKRLATLGAGRFIRFAASRGLQVRRPLADGLVEVARDALTTVDAPVARQVLGADLALLTELSAQIEVAEAEIARLLPLSPFATLTTTPGWGVVRAGNYAGALGDPQRWPGPSQIYRAAGLSPTQYESAGKRRDGTISREGSVALRRALIDLGMGLWFNDAPGRAYADGLKARGKKGGVIACAMAHRATRIAYAMVRDEVVYDPARWA